MPKVIDATDQRLADAIADAHEMLLKLQPLLAEPDGAGPQTGTIGRHAPESSEPWNTVVANAYWNLWFGPGMLVATVRYAMGMSRRPDADLPRGPDAFKVLADLLAGPRTADVVKLVIGKLERWVTMAQAIPALDEAEPWLPVPGAPGQHPPPCPYCRTFGLRMQKRRGQVRCTMPGCKDADGLPTRARMEPGAMTGEERLVFSDGTTMFWTGDGDEPDR